MVCMLHNKSLRYTNCYCEVRHPLVMYVMFLTITCRDEAVIVRAYFSPSFEMGTEDIYHAGGREAASCSCEITIVCLCEKDLDWS